MAELNARIIAKASATASEEPLAADLEVAELAVNTADGKLFTKHTDGSIVTISGGGGGGLNEIQSADDFALSEQTGVLVLTDKVSGMASTSPASEWDIFVTGSQFYYSPLQTTLTDNLSSGDTITMQVPGMAEPFTTTLTQDPSDTAGYKFFNISPSAPAEIIGAANGTNLTITSSNLPGSPTPLVEGDVLQWNDADQKFKPAQIPVDSVNGETGVVSLGIQEMDDFELLTPTQTPGYNWSSYLNSSQLWDYAASGKYRLKASTVEVADWFLSICSFDSSGVDRDSDWATVEVGDQITLSEDGTVWHTFEVTTVGRYDSDFGASYVKPVYNLGLIEVSASIPDLATWTSGFYTDPLHRADFQPLADNDILQWNNADQKFKPSSDLISLSTLQQVVADSTDFADFQTRVAAL